MHEVVQKATQPIQMIHLDLLSPVGREAATHFQVDFTPTTLIFDHAGELVYRLDRVPKTKTLLQIVE